MRWTRTAQRLAVVDGYRFSAGVRHRFTAAHADLDAAAVTLVEDAARQWFRLAARDPKAELWMPSVIVGDLWKAMILDGRGYAPLEPLIHRTASATGNRAARLATTFRLAQEDEGCHPEVLPLLFRVDRTLGIEGGTRYLADCGGRGQCHELPGAICLRHVSGTENPKRWRPDRHANIPPPGTPDAGGFGG